jgi:hypothetical protein
MDKSVHSFESVWATLDRIGEKIEQSREEADRRAVEADRREVEADRREVEADRRAVEADRKFEQSRAEAERETQALKDAIKQVNQQIGGIGKSNGAVAEEFFYNSLLHGQRNLFGEKFDDVIKGDKVTINKGYEDEYDILMVNGRAVCVVEVKYKADSSDLPQVFRKAQTFRVNFPQHNQKSVYLALAGMSFTPLTEQVCKDNGIAVMKQVGNAMVITDENLKTF